MKISFSPAKWGMMMMGNQGLKEMLKVRAELVLISYAYAKVFAVPLLEVARVGIFVFTFYQSNIRNPNIQ